MIMSTDKISLSSHSSRSSDARTLELEAETVHQRLHGLFAGLKAAGFACHTQEQLDAQTYLLALISVRSAPSSVPPKPLDASALQHDLCAIFAHTPEQQQQFHQHFQRWWQHGLRLPLTGGAERHSRLKLKSRTPWVVLGFLLCFALLMIFRDDLRQRCGELCGVAQPSPTPSVELAEEELIQDETDRGDENTEEEKTRIQENPIAAKDDQIINAEIINSEITKTLDRILLGMALQQQGLKQRIQHQTELIRTQQTQRWQKALILSLVIVSGLVFLGLSVWFAWQRRHRDQINQRIPAEQQDGYPFLKDKNIGLHQPTLKALTQTLQQRAQFIGLELDITQSIQHTLQAGLSPQRYPQLCYQARHQAPTLLVLVEKSSATTPVDLLQFHVEHTLKALQQQGINLLVYRYHYDTPQPLEHLYYVNPLHPASDKAVHLNHVIESSDALGVLIIGSSSAVWHHSTLTPQLNALSYWPWRCFMDHLPKPQDRGLRCKL